MKQFDHEEPQMLATLTIIGLRCRFLFAEPMMNPLREQTPTTEKVMK
jgi:hypothetical protein